MNLRNRRVATKEAIAAIARSYNILQSCSELKALLRFVNPTESYEVLSKGATHRLINDLLVSHGHGESFIKSKLVDRFAGKKVTAAFEIRVHNSRADFLTINGNTQSFEIKSQLDNLGKLSRQTRDYERVFEYNNVVVDSCHLEKALLLVPHRYGVIVVQNRRLFQFREAELNQYLDPDLQLQLFY